MPSAPCWAMIPRGRSIRTMTGSSASACITPSAPASPTTSSWTPGASGRVARERSAGELADHYVAGSSCGTDAPWFVVAAAGSRPGSRATYFVCHQLSAGDERIRGLAAGISRLRDGAAACRLQVRGTCIGAPDCRRHSGGLSARNPGPRCAAPVTVRRLAPMRGVPLHCEDGRRTPMWGCHRQ